MSEHPHHESLRLQNFTAFANASFEFVPGINVFIGENGTGKTHAMKAMYAWQPPTKGRPHPTNLWNLFQTDDVGVLVRDREQRPARASGVYGDESWSFEAEKSNTVGFSAKKPSDDARRQVFVPALDMMGHTKGFVSTFDLYKIDFDLTQREIVSLLLAPELRELGREQQRLTSNLEEALGGELELEGERFYLRTAMGRFPMPTVAEGLRKIATLLRLVQGGWLRPGATLFWDEPEVNLNPKLMDEVVGALLALSRNGVQIFVATHSYVILKELDLQSEEGEVRYFTFKQSEEGTTVTWDSDFGALEPNAILDQYDKMLIEGMKKADRESETSGRR